MAIDLEIWQCTCGGRIVYNGFICIDEDKSQHYINYCEQCHKAYERDEHSPNRVPPPQSTFSITDAGWFPATSR